MEGAGGELINAESKTMNDLEGALTEAEKEVQRLREKITIDLFEKHLKIEEDADDREPEVNEMVEKKAEEIIPKECWGLVFRHLDAEDLLSCRQVCKTFNQLLDLKEFKVKWQFHLILPQLFPYLENEPARNSWKHLSNPRLACRSWRHSIDKYASEVYGNNLFPSTIDVPLVTRFKTSEDIEEFWEKFGGWKGSPFPSRSVCIGDPDGDWEEDDYWARKRLEDAFNSKVGQLLEHFGKHIFRLELDLNRLVGYPDVLSLCKLVKTVQTHLPNLIEFFIRSRSPNEDDEEVASYIAENPLGPLPKLEALSLSRLNKKVEDYLLSACAPQLTRIQMFLSKNMRSQFHMQRFKNLRKLQLSLGKPKDILESFRFLQSPLEFLQLTCAFGSRARIQTWNVDKCLSNLQHLPIELLKIKWIWLRVKFAEAGIDLEAYKNTSIKTLIIDIHPNNYVNGQISFNFLQAMTNLENLKFKFSRRFRISHPGELPEVVRLNEYLFGEEGTNGIYESNVWEKVPSLKTLTIGLVEDEIDDAFITKTIFTREEYERIRSIAEGDAAEEN